MRGPNDPWNIGPRCDFPQHAPPLFEITIVQNHVDGSSRRATVPVTLAEVAPTNVRVEDVLNDRARRAVRDVLGLE